MAEEQQKRKHLILEQRASSEPFRPSGGQNKLRVEVKRPYESNDEFRNRHRGSIHSDIWRGPAADLASRGVIAVFPVSGWWKLRPKLERYDQKAEYSLIVSIRAPEVSVKLYSAIENRVKTPVEV